MLNILSNTPECGGCGLCCKLLSVQALDKPANKWCSNFHPKKKCTCYGTRPEPCQSFECDYRAGRLGKTDTLRPDKIHALLFAGTETGAADIQVHMDPDHYASFHALSPGAPLFRLIEMLRGRGASIVLVLGEQRKYIAPSPLAKFHDAQPPLRILDLSWSEWEPATENIGERFRSTPCCSVPSRGEPLPPHTLLGICTRCRQAYVEFNSLTSMLRYRGVAAIQTEAAQKTVVITD